MILLGVRNTPDVIPWAKQEDTEVVCLTISGRPSVWIYPSIQKDCTLFSLSAIVDPQPADSKPIVLATRRARLL